MWGQSSNVYSKLPYSQNLLCWYAADKLFGEGSTLPSDASAISFVSDLSGNSNHLFQLTALYQPTFRTNVINSLPVMRFTTSQLASVATSNNKYVSQTASTGSIMMFAVALVTTPSVLATIISTAIGTGTASRANLHFVNNTYAIGGRRLDANAFQTAVGGTATSGTPVLISGVLDYSNAVATIYANGVLVATNSSFQTAGVVSATSGWGIGVGSTIAAGTLFTLNGDIAECMIYPGMTTTADRNAVEAYLRTKYAIV